MKVNELMWPVLVAHFAYTIAAISLVFFPLTLLFRLYRPPFLDDKASLPTRLPPLPGRSQTHRAWTTCSGPL